MANEIDDVRSRIEQLQEQQAQGTAPPDAVRMLEALNQRMQELQAQQPQAKAPRQRTTTATRRKRQGD